MLAPPALVVSVVVEPLTVDSVAPPAPSLVEVELAPPEPTRPVPVAPTVVLPTVILALAAWVVAAMVELASVFVVPSLLAPSLAAFVGGGVDPPPSSVQLSARQTHERQIAVTGQL